MLTVKRSATAFALCCALLSGGALAQKGAVEKRHDKFTGTTRVTLAPQIVYEQGAERVTLSAYYDPAEHRRLTYGDTETPVMVNLEFAFTPPENAPETNDHAQVIYLIDNRRERAQPAVIKRRRIGTSFDDHVRVLTDVSTDLLKRISGARHLEVRIGERAFAINETIVAHLAEFARAIEK